MAKIIRFGIMALVVALTAASHPALAQETKPAAVANEVARKQAQIPLKLQLVLSRYQGEKKISSVPYQLWLTTNEAPTRIRMGLQIPVPTTTFGQSGVNTVPVSSYNLKSVGTNIDCSASPGLENGVYKLSLTVSDSSYPGQKEVGASIPTFREFTSTVTILLRDGQTAQFATATDPVSGEVLKIDATLNVLK